MIFKDSLHYLRNTYKPLETLKQLQWRKLQSAIHYAYENVPFYQKRFDDCGLKPTDIRSASDMLRIPILTKDEFRNAGAAVLAKGYHPSKLRQSTTSGSTGQPTDSYFALTDWFILKYLLKARSKMICGFLPSIHKVVIVSSQPENWAAKENTKIINKFLRRHILSINQDIEQHIKLYKKFKPAVLYGTVSYLNELKDYLIKNDIRWFKLKMIFTSGEIRDPHSRNGIEAALGCPSYDIYGSTELKEVAWECPHKTGYHVNIDAYYLEFINHAGHVGEYEEGRIIITSLSNPAMPLIRYDLGDRGIYTSRTCSCGNNFPLILSIKGRTVDYFNLGDNRKIAPFTLIVALHDCASHAIRQFQIIQKSADWVVIKVVPNRKYTKGIEAQLLQIYRRILGRNVNTQIEIVESIQREGSNKYQIVKSECN